MKKSRLGLCSIVAAAILILFCSHNIYLHKREHDYENLEKKVEESDLFRLSIPEFIRIIEEFPELAGECDQEYAALMAASYKNAEQTIQDYRKIKKIFSEKSNRVIAILASSDENLDLYTIPEFERALDRYPNNDDKALAIMAASWKSIDEVFSDYNKVKILVPEVKYDDVSASNMASSFKDLESYVIPKFRKYKKRFLNISNNAASTMASVHKPYDSWRMDEDSFREASENWIEDDYVIVNNELAGLDDVSAARMVIAHKNVKTWIIPYFRDIKRLVPIISRQKIPYVTNRAAAILASSFYFGKRE